MSNAPVATRYTLEFVRQHVRGGSLLEIGCGAGELAACLANDGFDVAALDSDPDCVSLADYFRAVWAANALASFTSARPESPPFVISASSAK